MYLISIYFDKKTNDCIQGYIDAVANNTGNAFMLDHNVPSHITVSAFETNHINQVIEQLKEKEPLLRGGNIDWVTVGQFLPSVIYIAPVLGYTLTELSMQVHSAVSKVEGVGFNKCYQPLSWFPHTTIGETLTEQEMQKAFDVLQHTFAPFSGEVVRVELAKKNPYSVLWSLNLKK